MHQQGTSNHSRLLTSSKLPMASPLSSDMSFSSGQQLQHLQPSPIRPPQQQQHIVSPSSSFQGLGGKPLLNPIGTSSLGLSPSSSLSSSHHPLHFHGNGVNNQNNNQALSLEGKHNTPSSFGKFINFSQLSTKKQLTNSNTSSLNNSLANFNNDRYNHNSNIFEDSASRMSNQTPELFSSHHDDEDHHSEDNDDHHSIYDHHSVVSPKASSTTGSAVKSKLKFSELGSKISAIDESMMQQEKVRKKRQQQMQGLEQKIELTNSNLSQVENRTMSLEAALEKIETLFYQEQGVRNLSEKNIISLMEEKFNQLAIKINQEREQRILEDESNRKRIKALEEGVTAINLSLDSLSQELSSQNSQLSLLAANFNSFTNQYKQDRKQLIDQRQLESKEIQLQFGDVKQKIANMESEMHKQDTFIMNQLNANVHDLSQELSRLRAEVDNKTKTSVEPMMAQIQQLFSTLESNKTQFTLQIGTLQQQLASQKSEILSEYMNPKFERVEKAILLNDKTQTKHVFDLKADVEKKNEMLESAITKLKEMLTHEESQRLESENNLLQLLSKTMKRIQNGIESTTSDTVFTPSF
ncbi:hypothetical protein C9374_012360 [Naegleria lovaniensis]|uniref:Uncharacterized protein n=1 Tax=Naegleria lovaniensis TaxID=51637 RepID=A0AA88GCV5_NAELO|nr:uncharacterized protein C9374_012360 [Naegleria lovaniensis]KAG2373257.1 hypothetical protein C9374_012360 [Naegleria lovaniensis]